MTVDVAAAQAAKVLTGAAESRVDKVLREKALGREPTSINPFRRLANPDFLGSGEAAMARAVSQLQTPTMFSFPGQLELRSGTLCNKKYLTTYVDGLYVCFVTNSGLYMQGTIAFRDLVAMEGVTEGVQQGEWMIRLVRWEIDLIIQLAAPWARAINRVRLVSLLLTIQGRRRDVETALDEGQRAVGALIGLRERSPALFAALMKTAAKQWLTGLPDRVTAEEVVECLAEAVEEIIKSRKVSLGAVLRVVAATAMETIAVKLVGGTAEAIEKAVKEHAAKLQAHLAQAQLQVTPQEAEQILRETLSSKETLNLLKETEQALKLFIPSVERVAEGYR
jgi:hypothetical protein